MKPHRLTMDFFGAQDVARQQTRILLAHYILAIASIVLTLHIVYPALFYPIRWYVHLWCETLGVYPRPDLAAWGLLDWRRLAIIAGVSVPLFALASIYKSWQMAHGGARVAESMGGTRLPDRPMDPYSQQLKNVVEEMAIAAAIPCPPVYVIHREPAINAFAAGMTPQDAVIALTWPALRILTRRELQALVGHELSHIVNGDMRLNMRLTGVLYGIAFVGDMLRRLFLWTTRMTGGLTGSLLVVAAYPLFFFGFLGLVPARLIKGAVSRQREFNADAQSVQYTRDPASVASLLKTIGGFGTGSRVMHFRSEELSHFFIADPLAAGIFSRGLLSTHPPIVDRIRRIEPSFDGTLEFVGTSSNRKQQDGPAFSSEAIARAAAGVGGSSFRMPTVGADAPTAAECVAGRMVRAFELELPEEVVALVAVPRYACALVYALLLSSDEQERERQLARIADKAGAHLQEVVRATYPCVEGLRVQSCEHLLMGVVETQRKLTPDEFQVYRELVGELCGSARAESRIVMLVREGIEKHLDPVFGVPEPEVRKISRGAWHYREPIALLFSALAHGSAGNPGPVFERAKLHMKWKGVLPQLVPGPHCTPDAIRRAIEALAAAPESVRRQVLEAAGASTAAIAGRTPAAGELLQALQEGLDPGPG